MDVFTAGGQLTGIEYEPIRNTPTLESMKLPIKVSVTRGVFVPKDTPGDAFEADMRDVLKSFQEIYDKYIKAG